VAARGRTIPRRPAAQGALGGYGLGLATRAQDVRAYTLSIVPLGGRHRPPATSV
jgi:hypothetical protein